MHLSRSLGAQGHASGAGNALTRTIRRPKCLTVSKFRFFETTGLAVLTTLIQHYRVETHPKFAGESLGQLKERYYKVRVMLTLK